MIQIPLSINISRFTRLLSLIALLLLSSNVSAQVVIGARSIGLGQANAALVNDEWAGFGNPALLNAASPSTSFYGIRNYGFSELTDYAASFAFSHKYGISAVSFHRYGDELFNETRVRGTYKNEFENVHFGATINYSSLQFGGPFGSTGALGIDVGIASELTPGLWLGARATNINRPRYGDTDEDLARELALGFSYRLTNKALLVADVVKDVRFPTSFRGGVEIELVERVFARSGVSTEPNTYSFGFGYKDVKWQFDIAVQQHTVLGLSPGIGFKMTL